MELSIFIRLRRALVRHFSRCFGHPQILVWWTASCSLSLSLWSIWLKVYLSKTFSISNFRANVLFCVLTLLLWCKTEMENPFVVHVSLSLLLSIHLLCSVHFYFCRRPAGFARLVSPVCLAQCWAEKYFLLVHATRSPVHVSQNHNDSWLFWN